MRDALPRPGVEWEQGHGHVGRVPLAVVRHLDAVRRSLVEIPVLHQAAVAHDAGRRVHDHAAVLEIVVTAVVVDAVLHHLHEARRLVEVILVAVSSDRRAVSVVIARRSPGCLHDEGEVPAGMLLVLFGVRPHDVTHGLASVELEQTIDLHLDHALVHCRLAPVVATRQIVADRIAHRVQRDAATQSRPECELHGSPELLQVERVAPLQMGRRGVRRAAVAVVHALVGDEDVVDMLHGRHDEVGEVELERRIVRVRDFARNIHRRPAHSAASTRSTRSTRPARATAAARSTATAGTACTTIAVASFPA